MNRNGIAIHINKKTIKIIEETKNLEENNLDKISIKNIPKTGIP